MVVTAAAITAAGAVGAAGIGAASSAGAFGGGKAGGGSPTVKQLPPNMQDQAIKGYNERLILANETKQAPTFGSVLQGGTVGANAQFPITDPGMTPAELAGAGFVDRHGNPMPTTPQADIGAVQQQGLSPQQRFMLAKQQMWRAQDYGGTTPAWASNILGRATHINTVDQRVTDLQANPNANQNLIARLQQQSAMMKSNQNKALGGSYYS